jgi:hypothetical protein
MRGKDQAAVQVLQQMLVRTAYVIEKLQVNPHNH